MQAHPAGEDAATGDDVVLRKAHLRRTLRDLRRGLSLSERRTAGQQLAVQGIEALQRVFPAGLVGIAGYVPLPGEPDVSGLLARLREDGVPVLLPIARHGLPLRWAVDDGSRLRAEIGGDEPAGRRISTAEMLDRVDLVLVPALAVDSTGARLGQGGGFYDRAFAGERRRPLWGVVHESEVIDDVPAEEHDLRLDGILTPSGFVGIG